MLYFQKKTTLLEGAWFHVISWEGSRSVLCAAQAILFSQSISQLFHKTTKRLLPGFIPLIHSCML